MACCCGMHTRTGDVLLVLPQTAALHLKNWHVSSICCLLAVFGAWNSLHAGAQCSECQIPVGNQKSRCHLAAAEASLKLKQASMTAFQHPPLSSFRCPCAATGQRCRRERHSSSAWPGSRPAGAGRRVTRGSRPGGCRRGWLQRCCIRQPRKAPKRHPHSGRPRRSRSQQCRRGQQQRCRRAARRRGQGGQADRADPRACIAHRSRPATAAAGGDLSAPQGRPERIRRSASCCCCWSLTCSADGCSPGRAAAGPTAEPLNAHSSAEYDACSSLLGRSAVHTNVSEWMLRSGRSLDTNA